MATKPKSAPSQDAMRLALTKFLEPSAVKQRMYHGTGKDFISFKPNTRGVHFVTPNPDVANLYAGQEYSVESGESPNVMPLYVSAKNPFDYENKKHRDALSVKAALSPNARKKLKEGLWHQLEDRTIMHSIKNMGHDSLYVNEHGSKNLGVFNPNQIKSAIGNRGTYDPNDPDITKAQGGAVNPFDYENPQHVSTVAAHAAKHQDFKAYDPNLLGEVLKTGNYRHIEDPRMQDAMRKAGHDSYHLLEKTGKKLHKMQTVVKKAMGGTVEQMRQELQAAGKPFGDISQIGAQEAPSMPVKNFIPVNNGATGPMPMGGIDMSPQQPGQQMLPASLMQPQQPQGEQGAPQGQPSPLGSTGSPPPQGGSNILQMTQQGQALNAMKPPQPPANMAIGGLVPTPVMNHPFQAAGDRPLPFMAKDGGSDNAPMNNDYSDNGATDFSIDNIQQLNGGGGVQGYASKGYVHHTDINPHPMAGQRYKTSGHGVGLAPINHVDVESMMGGSFGVAPWDTSGSHVVEGVSGHDLINPVQLEAGQNFPRKLDNIAAGRGGASGRKVVEGQQERISRAISQNLGNKGTGKVYTSPMTMKAATSSNFSTMPIEIQLDLMHQAGLDMNEIKELNNQVRALKGMENFVGFEDPNLWEHITKGDERKVKSLANVRKAMTKVLASKENQQRMDYNFEDLVGAITDPDLRGVPMNYAGRILLEGQPNEVSGSPFMDSNHTSYSTGHRQKYVGGSHNAPVELWMPDSFEQEQARLLRENPSLKTNPNLRSQTINSLAWTKNPVGYQPINERVVRNIKRFEEGQKAGDINPNDLQGIFDYYKRKHGGYKKGGKVNKTKVTDNLDTMRLALTRNTKKKAAK